MEGSVRTRDGDNPKRACPERSKTTWFLTEVRRYNENSETKIGLYRGLRIHDSEHTKVRFL